MRNNRIGIVTVLYNSESVLDDFFRTLNEQTYKDFILYIIDNKSTDSSVQKGKECEKNVDFQCKWLLQTENKGIAEGNNIGIKEALKDNCGYILLANNDIVLDKNAIKALLEGLISSNSTMAVPKIYYWDNPKKIWMAGGGFMYLQFSTYHEGYDDLDKGQFDKNKPIKYAPTCFMLIDSSVFSRVGLMDKSYFVYFDDTDFIWRATIIGKEKLMYIYNSQIWHKVSSSTGGSYSDFFIRYINRNHIYFALKYCKGIHFIIFITYLIAHLLLRKPFRYNSRQYKLILKSYIEGIELYKKNKNKQ